MWPDKRVIELLGIELPIIQAPMAGSNGSALAIAVSNAGGLGSLPCATISPEQMRAELALIKQQTSRHQNLNVNVNFFVHAQPMPDAAREATWRAKLATLYARLGLDPEGAFAGANRSPFDDAYCSILEDFKPAVVSFHFGLPHADLLRRVKAWGAKVLSSATTVAEAEWLEAHGCDAIIAQGAEAGGHRGIFLSDDVIADVSCQPGTMALVPQIVDAVKLPVIAAGGIADGRGVAAAFMLGASAAQIGTAYMFCPEATTSALHRAALRSATADGTTLTNVFTGRPARGIVNQAMRELGPLTSEAPQFPLAANAMAPLKAAAEARGDSGFSALWSGQAARLGREMSAAVLTRVLMAEARALIPMSSQARS
jgi:nitronate monooxygenase